MRIFTAHIFLAGLLALAIPISGCKGGDKGIQNGSAVKMHYTLTVDGTVMDSSSGKEPLAFTQGSGQIIPGLDEQILGLNTGEKKKVTVSPEKGYGVTDPARVQKLPRASFSNVKDLKPGSVVRGQRGDQVFQATIVEIGKTEVTLDFNHPLAGKTLNFEIEILDIQPPV
ncbi:peptidylprolyl isomerase [Elusimicrobiota bacterium]